MMFEGLNLEASAGDGLMLCCACRPLTNQLEDNQANKKTVQMLDIFCLKKARHGHTKSSSGPLVKQRENTGA
jgi:hypothetical protein